jgi:CotS family spore coat protein
MVVEESAGLKEYLSLKYDIDILDITPVKNVMRITTSEGDKCLKKVKYKKEHFLFILSAMEHLLNNYFDGIVPFIPEKSGNLYVELQYGFGFLTDWVRSRECNYSNPIELKMAVTTLAKLHKCSENFIPAVGTQPRMGWGQWIVKFGKRMDEMMEFKRIIEDKGKYTYFDKLYIDNFDFYFNQGARAIEHLKETKYIELSQRESKKKSFCHHDYAHHNVLISENFKVYIIDFDYCICDTRLHDLSSLIIRNMRHGNWNMEKAQYIIDGYLNIGSIEKDEIPVMNAFIEFPQDFWQVGLQYYVEKLSWEEEQFNKRLERFVYDKYEREQFINDFKYSIEI